MLSFHSFWFNLLHILSLFFFLKIWVLQHHAPPLFFEVIWTSTWKERSILICVTEVRQGEITNHRSRNKRYRSTKELSYPLPKSVKSGNEALELNGSEGLSKYLYDFPPLPFSIEVYSMLELTLEPNPTQPIDIIIHVSITLSTNARLYSTNTLHIRQLFFTPRSWGAFSIKGNNNTEHGRQRLRVRQTNVLNIVPTHCCAVGGFFLPGMATPLAYTYFFLGSGGRGRTPMLRL